MKRGLLNFASKLGQGRRALELYDGIFDSPMGPDIEVDDKIRRYDLDDENVKGDVLLPIVRGQGGLVSYYMCILAHAFRTRGYNPVVPLCYNDLHLCHRKSPGNEDRSVCELCNLYGDKLLKKFGITPLHMSDIQTSEFELDEITKDIEYRGVQVSDYAIASSRKFLQKYNINLCDEYERTVYKKFLRGAIKHVDIGENIFKENRIEAVITHNAVYNESGIYLSVAENNNISAYATGLGYRNGYIMFGSNENKIPRPVFTNQKKIKEYLGKPLSESEEKKINTIMQKRASGISSRVPYSETGESIELEDTGTVVGMFTNLIWDGSLEVKSAPFPDVFDWIYRTIDFFTDNSATLIIRTHPAESIRGTNESVSESIRERYGTLPENVVLVDPDDDLNTYRLIRDLDVGLVYNSTVGLEMAYNNLPVIIGGDTHYRKLGFTHDPNTPEGYIDLLKEVRNLKPKEDTRTLARRYAHFLFVRKHIKFPFCSIDESVSGQLHPVSHDDVKPGNDNFDLIAERVLDNKPVIRE